MLKCKTCVNSIFDEIWGEWKCKIHKLKMCRERSDLVALCLDYKHDPKKGPDAEEKDD